MAITAQRTTQRPQVYDEDLPQVEVLPPEFGLAMFDLEDESSGGVCYSSAGGYRRFQSSADLSNTTLWVTNLKKFNQPVHNLRTDSFLGSRLDAIAADLGVELAGFKQVDGIDKGGMVDVARALTQTRDLAYAAYPWKDLDRQWRFGRLSEAIAEVLPAMEVPQANLIAALKGAYQNYSAPPRTLQTYEEGSRYITLRRNRVQHAMELLRTPVPYAGWHTLGPNTPLEAFMDPARPTLVHVNIEWRNAGQDMVNLIAFGADIGKPEMRRWVSQVELLWLVRYARITVLGALMASEARALPIQLQLPAVVGGDYVYWMSLANGLVAESHWKGLVSPKWNPKRRDKDYSVAGVWIRAMDRAISFQMALAAHENGAAVQGYGSGAVSVRVPNGSVQQLLELADAVGACHPCLASEVVGRERGDS